jgi:hypothetical protein
MTQDTEKGGDIIDDRRTPTGRGEERERKLRTITVNYLVIHLFFVLFCFVFQDDDSCVQEEVADRFQLALHLFGVSCRFGLNSSRCNQMQMMGLWCSFF